MIYIYDESYHMYKEKYGNIYFLKWILDIIFDEVMSIQLATLVATDANIDANIKKISYVGIIIIAKHRFHEKELFLSHLF